MTGRVLVHLERVSFDPDSSRFKSSACGGRALADFLHELHYGKQKERPTTPKLFNLVRRGRLNAAAKRKVLELASEHVVRSLEGETLPQDCRNILLALSHSPQTPNDLNELFKELYPELRKNSGDCGNRVNRATKALTDVGAVVPAGHTRMLSWRFLVPEKLAREARKAVRDFQKSEAVEDEQVRTLGRLWRQPRAQRPLAKQVE